VCRVVSAAHLVPAFERPLPPLQQVSLADTRGRRVRGAVTSCLRLHREFVHHLPVLDVLRTRGENTFYERTPIIPPGVSVISPSKLVVSESPVFDITSGSVVHPDGQSRSADQLLLQSTG